MENKNTCGCDCTMCHVGHHRRYRWLMIIVGVVLAFCVGMKLGELKSYVIRGGEYERGSYMMDNYYPQRNMMYGIQSNDAPKAPVAEPVAPKSQ